MTAVLTEVNMNMKKLYDEYTRTKKINEDILSVYPDDKTKIKAVTDFINTSGITDHRFITDIMRFMGHEGDGNSLAIRFLDLTEDKSSAKVFIADSVIRESVINNYCSVMANFIVFSTAQRKNLKDTASYNRHIDKALPEMRDSLMILFELGANEGEYLTSLDKYFEFTYYVNTPDSWNLFNSLYAYESFVKYVDSIKEKFLGIYLRSALLPEAVKKFVEEGDEKFTEAFITALSELASENTPSARKMYHEEIIVEGDNEFISKTIDLYDGMKFKEAIAHMRANGGKFHSAALRQAKEFYEYDESPRLKEFNL